MQRAQPWPRRDATVVLPALATAALITIPGLARADLRVHIEGGGVAPISLPLFDRGAGFNIGASIDYEVVNLLAVGVFYSFSDFMSTGSDDDERFADVFDHAVGARLDLRYIRHENASWFGTRERRAYGEAFIELDLAYHNIGNQSHVGWGVGLGYRALVAGPFGLGPFVRFRHIVADAESAHWEGERHHLLYLSFGLTMFLSFDLTRGDDEEEGGGAQGSRSNDDEWSEFEPASTEGGADETP
jgi:hypothetical protein